MPPFPVPDPEDDGVGVGAADDGGGDPELHARLAGQSKGAGDAGIVGLHAQKPGHQGAVGAVPFAGGGKGAVEEQLRRRGPAPQQMAGDEADACRPRRVGGRRPHHDGTHDVEDVHGEGLLIKK